MAEEIVPTPEQIAESNAYWTSFVGRTDRLSQQAARLHRLVKLNAPGIVIEMARRSVFRTMAALPADANYIKALEESDAATAQEEFEALSKAGFYDDKCQPGED